MRAVRINGSGKVSLDKVETPTITRPDQVLVKIVASGLCGTDIHTLDYAGRLAGSITHPFTLGHENAGVIEEAPENIDWLNKGDKVLLHPFITCGKCDACRYGNDMGCTDSRFPGVDGTDGGFADFMLTSPRSVLKLNQNDDLVTLAPLADAGNTVYHAIKRLLPKLLPGSNVLVLGVGGLGHLAIQILKNLTATNVIGADISEVGLRLAGEVGADYVLDAGKNSFMQDMKNLTSNRGMDVVFDFVGMGASLKDALEIAGSGGIVSVIGYGGKLELDSLDLIDKELTISGNAGGSFMELKEVVGLFRKGLIRPSIEQFPLDMYSEAIEKLRGHNIKGRAVLKP